MNISLPPELVRFVQRKVEDGLYKDPDDVVCAALRAFYSLQSPTMGRIFSVAGQAGMDVSEAAFLVMMMATKDMDEDIRMIMEEVKATTVAKQKLRDLIQKLNKDISANLGKSAREDTSDALEFPPGGMGSEGAYHRVQMPIPDPEVEGGVQFVETDLHKGLIEHVAILKTIREDLTRRLDSMNEMSEMTSLRLQMTMDRRSKFISTLSNIMKKISTTQDTLIQNLK